MSSITNNKNELPVIKFLKTDKDAVSPTKAKNTDIGFDLVCIKIHKELENGVILYDTGIAVETTEGFYTEIAPRSSISKTGWMLANSIGIIDPDYRGNLLVALMPIRKDAKRMHLPFCKCQLILRKTEECIVEEVSFLTDTERGTGGFGSTGDRV